MLSILVLYFFACEEAVKPTDCEGGDTGCVVATDTGEANNGDETDSIDTDDTTETDTDDTDTDDTNDTNTEETDDPEPVDVDGDGLSVEDGDCDDNDPSIPGDEYCDGIDNDCDGETDESNAVDAFAWYEDQDGDGYGVATSFRPACEQPDGYADNADDCDDSTALVSPAMAEIWYDGIDQACDGGDDYDADGDGFDDRMVDIDNTPQFVMELHPIGDNAGNALQGLAVDVERDEVWMSVDISSWYENVLINKLSLKSGNPLYCEEYTESNNLALGHGQDLSIEYLSNGQRRLWIGSEDDRGVTRINPDTMSIEVLSDLLPAGWSHSTPAIGLQNQWIAVRGSLDSDPISDDWIRIYEKSAVESAFSTGNPPSPLYEFNIDSQQRADAMWFQGIALDEEIGVVYALTGDNTLTQTDKLLYVYDLSGNVLRTVNINMDWSTANALGSKYEPEGLSLVKDPNSHQRYLYFTMMFGSSGNNIKRLYSIAPSSIATGGTYSNNQIDWLIRYNNSTGEVSISTATVDGEIGCETKRSTWTTGWSSFEGYYVNGDPHLLIQKEVPGTIKIHPLNTDATFDGTSKNDDWSNGWSDFHAWEHGGNSYLFYYKSGSASSGLMRTSELTNSGGTGSLLEDEYWSTGWKTHLFTLPNGDDFLLRYMPINQNVRIAPLTSGYIGADVYNSTWGSGYMDFDSVQSGATTYVVALDNNGMLSSFVAQNSGLLNTGDTETTVLTDWTSLVTYNLEGRAIVHLLRESDGFFALYELDANGNFQGPIESGFDQSNWTSIEHFQTSH